MLLIMKKKTTMLRNLSNLYNCSLIDASEVMLEMLPEKSFFLFINKRFKQIHGTLQLLQLLSLLACCNSPQQIYTHLVLLVAS